MAITVVGSIAFDTVATPFGRRERMVGGVATHFALAASFPRRGRVVGPVGDDFDDDAHALLSTRETNTDDVERIAGGTSFFWAGEYGWDLNSRETLDLEQCERPRFVALDSMNLWIDTAREALSWGPSAVVAKQGEYGAALLTTGGFFALPAYPLEKVADPTGAGDTFAGGFVGYLSRHIDQLDDEATLRRAMAYATAPASFTVQELRTDRVMRLTADELHERVADLQQMTRLDHARAELAR